MTTIEVSVTEVTLSELTDAIEKEFPYLGAWSPQEIVSWILDCYVVVPRTGEPE